MLSELIIGLSICNKSFSVEKFELNSAFLYIIKFLISLSRVISFINSSFPPRPVTLPYISFFVSFLHRHH